MERYNRYQRLPNPDDDGDSDNDDNDNDNDNDDKVDDKVDPADYDDEGDDNDKQALTAKLEDILFCIKMNSNCNETEFKRQYIRNLQINVNCKFDIPSKIREIKEYEKNNIELHDKEDVFQYMLKPVMQQKLSDILKNKNNEIVSSFFENYIMVDKGKEENKNLQYIIRNFGYSLKILDIYNYKSSKIMPILNRFCQNLRKIRLGFNLTQNEHFQKCFSEMFALRLLDIIWNSADGFPETLVKSLEDLVESLQALGLSRCVNDSLLFPDTFDLLFSKFNQLYILRIVNFNINQTTINSIGKIINLTEVKLILSSPHEKLDFYSIGNLKNLTTLTIEADNNVNDSFLINLCAKAKELKYLKLLSYEISDGGMMSVNNLKHLEYCNIHVNNFRETKKIDHITKRSLGDLICNELVVLSLAHFSTITDALAIKIVINLPKLEQLRLQYTDVTRSMPEKLAETKIKRNQPLKIWVTFLNLVRDFTLYRDTHNFEFVDCT